MIPQVWIGIDVSKNSFDAGLVTKQLPSAISTIPVQKFESTRQGLKEFFQWLDVFCKNQGIPAQSARIVMEATGRYSEDLCLLILEKRSDLEPAIVNPGHSANFQKSMGIHNKTDAVDARVLGIFGRERRPEPFLPRSAPMAKLRELHRLRKNFVDDRVSNELRLSEAKDKSSIRHLKALIGNLGKLIQKIEAEIKEILRQNVELGSDVKLLMTIPGVGLLSSISVLAEFGDLRRFRRSRQLASFAGLTPKIRESGTSVRGRAHITKAGNGVVRKNLYMAAMAAIRKESSCLSRFFNSLVAAGKSRKSALVAVMRKILILMRAILIGNQPYRFPGLPVEKYAKKPQTVKLML